MERHLRKISLALATLYALLAVGVPVYLVHCACSGQTQTTLLIEATTCCDVDPELQLACGEGDGCQYCSGATPTCKSGCDDKHGCKNGRMHYLVFKSTSEPLVVDNKLNLYPKILELVGAHLSDNDLLDRLSHSDLHDASRGGFVEIAPPLIQSSHKFLSFICQRKVYLA